MTKLSKPIYLLKRRAKSIAREEGIPLHQAQSRIARNEGFGSWSLLTSKATEPFADDLLGQFHDGDLVLLSARQGEGKTMLALRFLLDGRREGRRAVLFTLEFNHAEALARLRSIDADGLAESVEIETSDDIDAAYIVKALSLAPKGTVAVVDYLQLLDQCRSKPAISDQLRILHRFAKDRQIVLVFISQVDRSFDPTVSELPGMAHVRVPNPIPLDLFSKALFLHAGRVRFQNLLSK